MEIFSHLFSNLSPRSYWQILLICLIILPAGLIVPAKVSADDKTAPTLLVLGDSLSAAYGLNTEEGWVALLQQKLSSQGRNFNVINASVSGDTTRTGLSRIKSALLQHKPGIIIIALGGNDGLRGLAFSEIEYSLSSIIEYCLSHRTKVLLVGVRLPPNYGTVYNEQFAAVFRGLADRHKVSLVPQMLVQVAEHADLMQADGMHPKAEAQPIILENIWRELDPMLEAMSYSLSNESAN